ncbi:MAG: hypothetical protein HUK22_08395, partial [Thermoguttaceae bacterium]|nr:hypothetical protein [Thermoguttaceae bacterium]
METKLKNADESDKFVGAPARSKAALFTAFCAIGLFLVGIAGFILLWLRPDLGASPDARVALFRVQSCSMEPQYPGPRFRIQCPACGESFAVSIDVASVGKSPESVSPPSNAESPEARRFRETTRFFACPLCGYDQAPTSNAEFQDGALVEFPPQFVPEENESATNVWAKLREFFARRHRVPRRWD